MMNVSWNHLLLGDPRSVGHDAPVIAADPSFYQLGEFHDQQLALSQLGVALKERGTLVRCSILNVWYIPRKSLQVIYCIRLRQPANTEMDLTLNLSFYPADTSLSMYKAAVSWVSDRDSIVHVPGWNAVAWVFPADPRLVHLAAMLDAKYVIQQLRPVLGAIPPDPAPLTWKLLSYLPGERCTLMYQFGVTEHMFIGKIQRAELTRHQYSSMLQLWHAPQRQFRMAQPLLVDVERGIRWEQFVGGQRFEDLFAGVALDMLIRQALEGLVNLHSLSVTQLPTNGPQQILARIGRKAMRRLWEILPALEGASGVFFDELAQKAAMLVDRPLCTIHGDFHTANILVDQDGVIMLDLDNLAQGDPAYDVALFGSRILLLALHRGERLNEVARLIARLPAAYMAAGGAAIPDYVFAWYLAALLVGRQIKTCIRHYAPELGRLTPLLLGYASDTIQRGRFEATIVAR